MRLHIIQGDKAGAEMDLQPARYALGASGKCDIRIEGAEVLGEHLEAVFADGVLTLLSAAGAVFVDGKAITTFPHDVHPLQAVTMGRAAFAFGAPDSTWPEAPQIAREEAAQAQAALPPKSHRLLWTSLAAVLVLFVAGGIYLLDRAGAARDRAEQQEQAELSRARTDLLQKLQATLRGSSDYRGVRLEDRGTGSGTGDNATGGEIVLSGVVEDSATLTRLQAFATPEDATAGRPRITLRIRTLGTIDEEVGLALSSIDGQLTHRVSLSEIGNLEAEVRGVVADATSAKRIAQFLERDTGFLSRVETNLTTPDEIVRLGEQPLLAEADYAGATLTYDNGKITIGGTLFEADASRVRGLVESGIADLPVRLEVVLAADLLPATGGRITGLILGATSVARLVGQDGTVQLVRESDTLKSGYQVQRIDAGGLTLSYDNKVLHLSAKIGSDD